MRWESHVPLSGITDRWHYELRIQAGDVWAAGSRQYRSYKKRLISPDAMRAHQQARTLPVAVEADFDSFIAARQALLDKRLAEVNARAKDGLLPGVAITRGVLKVAPVEKSTPPAAEALAARLYAMPPRIRIIDLLAEVAQWTGFPGCFTHLRTGEAAADPRILMAGLLADGLNLGLTRKAEACSIGSPGQLAWTADWHIREETYALVLRRLVNQQGSMQSRGVLTWSDWVPCSRNEGRLMRGLAVRCDHPTILHAFFSSGARLSTMSL